MSSTPSIPEEVPGARAGATEINYIPKSLGRGLRVWWAFYWRKSLVFAILVTALLLTVDPLYQRGAIPFWLFHYLLEFGPYAINYAVALPAIHFILRKKFRDFRIGLVATHTGTAAEVLQPSFARAFRIWWAYSWRTFAYCIGIYFVVSIPLGLLVEALGTIFPRWNDAFAYAAGLAIEGAAGLFVIYSNILDEDFSDFRVCLLPRKTAPMVQDNSLRQGLIILAVLVSCAHSVLAQDLVSDIREEADAGNASAQAGLGYFYEHGLEGLPTDATQAVAWYRKAADQGYAPGEYNLGVMYEQKVHGLHRSDKQAVYWFRKAADQRDALAEDALGLMYEKGRGGLKKDKVLAGYWFSRAIAQAGSAKQPKPQCGCEEWFGALQLHQGHAVDWLLAVADRGDAAAADEAGLIYMNGLYGREIDNAQALRWFQKSADKGNPLAENSIGVMFQRGLGGQQKDDVQAVLWYRKAGDQGYAPAESNLGYMYENGRGGLPKDDAQAVTWYRKAADQGYAPAENNLGYMYESGRGGLSQDDTQAFYWYRKAADQGNSSGENGVAWLYAASTNPALRNPKLALQYALQAVQQERDGYNLDTLAAAYAVNCRWADAVAAEQEAVKAASTDSDESGKVPEFKKKIIQYQEDQAKGTSAGCSAAP